MNYLKHNSTSFPMLFCMIWLSGLTIACNKQQPAQKTELLQAMAAPVQEPTSAANPEETLDKSIFTGRYSATNEEEGVNYLLNVQLEDGKLMLGFRSGGTMEFSYGEKSIEEKAKGTEYLVNTEDFDGNGSVSFLFKCEPGKKATEVLVTWLEDQEMKPIVLKAE